MPKVGGFWSFNTARRSIQGFEAMLWLRKGGEQEENEFRGGRSPREELDDDGLEGRRVWISRREAEMADTLHNARTAADEVGSVITQQWEQVAAAITMLEAAMADPQCAPEVQARREWLRAHALLLCAIPATSRADVGEKYCALAVIHSHEGVHDSLAAPMIVAAIEADLERLGLTADEVTGEHD